MTPSESDTLLKIIIFLFIFYHLAHLTFGGHVTPVPFVENDPTYGTVYHVGSPDEALEMAKRENMLVFMPHPRSKATPEKMVGPRGRIAQACKGVQPPAKAPRRTGQPAIYERARG